MGRVPIRCEISCPVQALWFHASRLFPPSDGVERLLVDMNLNETTQKLEGPLDIADWGRMTLEIYRTRVFREAVRRQGALRAFDKSVRT
jgi:hypothetical protein